MEKPEALATALQALSAEMLELGRAGDWEAVARRERQRRDLIRKLFASLSPEAAAPCVAESIRKVLADNAELVALGRKRLEATARELDNLVQGRKARLAYNAD